MNQIKLYISAVLLLMMSIVPASAQYFTATLDHTDNNLIVKIRPNPGGGDITISLSQFEIFMRKLDAEPNFTFDNLIPNLSDFPGITSLAYAGVNTQSASDSGYTNYHFSYSTGTGTPATLTYVDGQEYEVFRVDVQGDPVEMADFEIAANPTSFSTYFNITSGSTSLADPANVDFFYGNTGSAPGTGGGTTFFESEQNVALPIVLNSFDANRKGKNHALIEWETVSEINASHFEVQRSDNTRDWRTLTTVKCTTGNAKGGAYEYFDLRAADHKNEDDQLYYRLNMIDLDGQSEYSETRSVRFEVVDYQAKVYPSPARISDQVTFAFAAPSVGDQLIYILNNQGLVVKQYSIVTSEVNEVVELLFDIDQSMTSGNYMILYGTERDLISQFTVLK